MSEERTTQRELAQDKMNNEIMFALGEIKGSMKGVEKTLADLAPIVADHEKRIERSEKTLYNIKIKIGLIGAVVGALVSSVIDWAVRRLSGH